MVFNPFRNKPEFPTNERLLKAIAALAAQGMSQAGRPFYTALLESTLLIAEEPSASRPILLAGDKEDEVILPVFTDVDRLKRVFADAERIAAIRTREICRMALKNDIHMININPEHGPGGYLTRDEMEALANNAMPDLSDAEDRQLGQGGLVPFGNPKIPTQDVIDTLLDAACGLLQKEPNVEEAYLILTRQGDDDSVLTIGLLFGSQVLTEDKSTFSQQFIPTLEAVIERRLHTIWLTERDLAAIRQNVEPFYMRTT
jgi:hypothetical protein